MASRKEQVRFKKLNQRRLELIEKKYGKGLTEAEERELTELQTRADQRVEGLMAVDPKRLKELRSTYNELTRDKGSPVG